MRSRFKYPSITRQQLFKISHFNKLKGIKGDISFLPLIDIVDNKLVNIWIHNGKQENKIKASNIRLLVNENFFFIRKLKVGNFRFTKKHCIFKKKLRKKK